MDYLIFILSLVLLIIGANFIIREAERIALHFNISSFVIGATLVALGTSLPEMAASMMASYNGKSELAISNVIGSNTFNIALILGLVFIFSKGLHPKRDLFAKDASWAIFPLLIFLLMIFDNRIDRFEGVLLLLFMAAYLLFLTRDAKELISIDIEELRTTFLWPKSIFLLGIGFVLVIGGAHFTIDSASNIARLMGISEWMVGLILIAFGTSLPELAVSLVAIRRGNADMSIGNIIGSNLANISVVLGSAALVGTLSIDSARYVFDITVMGFLTLMLVFITANKLYNASAGIVLLSVLGLFLYHTAIGV